MSCAPLLKSNTVANIKNFPETEKKMEEKLKNKMTFFCFILRIGEEILRIRAGYFAYTRKVFCV